MKRRTFLGALGALFLPMVAVAKTIVDNKITSPTEEEDFYQFFLNFNGFPINEMQKTAFKQRYSNHNIGLRDRRSGVTTFLMTLAAWESLKGIAVILAHSNHCMKARVYRECMDKCDKIGISTASSINMLVANDKQTYPLRGKSYDVCLYDCSGDDFQSEWYKNTIHIGYLRKKFYALALQTTEY
jgi:hypothetical protein